ncbi:MAG: discoidin domain-containing protein [Actinomycetota bacterium]
MNHSNRSKIILLSLFATVAVVAAACSSGGASSDSEVRDFTEIQSSDFEFSVLPNGVAVMNVLTDVEAVCSIAWGDDENLGNINTDLDMGGHAHQDHEVVLVGAEPGGTYSFRVQGATADGSLFQSELATFTLPEIPEGADAMGDDDMDDGMAVHGANLAEGATVIEVSSIFSETWAGENAVDGDMTTEWATAGSGDDAFIEIDLGSPQEVVGVEFITRTMGDGTATTTEFTVTVDGGDVFGPFAAGDQNDPGFAEAGFTGQVLRYDVVSSTGGNTGAIEVRAFAPTGS